MRIRAWLTCLVGFVLLLWVGVSAWAAGEKEVYLRVEAPEESGNENVAVIL